MTSKSVPGNADGRAARWAGQRERRRCEFVDAALRAIAEHGPDASTEQIATAAGVARTRLYKYFADAADLQSAISDRVVELLTVELAPIWNPHGTPTEMIRAAIDAHTGWIAENSHLYLYLTVHSASAKAGGRNPITDSLTAIGEHLAMFFRHYLDLFDLDARLAEPIAFGLVGLVDSTVNRWLANPNGIARADLAALLARWVWRILDDTLREHGVELDPDEPLAAPDLAPALPADRHH